MYRGHASATGLPHIDVLLQLCPTRVCLTQIPGGLPSRTRLPRCWGYVFDIPPLGFSGSLCHHASAFRRCVAEIGVGLQAGRVIVDDSASCLTSARGLIIFRVFTPAWLHEAFTTSACIGQAGFRYRRARVCFESARLVTVLGRSCCMRSRSISAHGRSGGRHSAEQLCAMAATYSRCRARLWLGFGIFLLMPPLISWRRAAASVQPPGSTSGDCLSPRRWCLASDWQD